MDHNLSPSSSALEASAAYLRGLCAVMWSGLGWFVAKADPWAAINDWVNGIFRKLDAMLIAFQAGKLVAPQMVVRPTPAVPPVLTNSATTARPTRDGRSAVRVMPRLAEMSETSGDLCTRDMPRHVARALAPSREIMRVRRWCGGVAAGWRADFAKTAMMHAISHDLNVPACD